MEFTSKFIHLIPVSNRRDDSEASECLNMRLYTHVGSLNVVPVLHMCLFNLALPSRV